MKKCLILFLLLFIHINQLTYAESDKKIICDGKQVLGEIEKIVLLERQLSLNAKLDTGAQMSSLSASNISIFQSNNKKWVRFTFYSPSSKTKIIFTKPLLRYVHILKRQEEQVSNAAKVKQFGERPVVSFLICVGNQQKNIQVNLIDRTQFHYPLLLGKNALKVFNILVDVNRKYLTTPKCTKGVVD